MDNNNEIIWKDVVINNIITNYEVNNIGQVRNKNTGNILKPRKHGKSYNDYIIIDIYYNKKYHTNYLHRLVAYAFIPNDDPENKTQVNHKDGNKSNNCVENLEWCSSSENIQHAYDNKLNHVGSEHHFSKYNELQINCVCRLLYEYIPMNIISKLTKVNQNQIKLIKNGYSWKHISSKYNINYHKKYTNIKITYKKLRKILIELNMFNNIDLNILLEYKYIIHKKKLIDDIEKLGYEIFLYKYEIDEICGKNIEE